MTSLSSTIATGPIDIAPTLKTLGIYPGDPSHRWGQQTFTKAVITPEGPATAHLQWGSGEVVAEVWGDGARWIEARLPFWLGLHDDLTGFEPARHPKIADLWKRHGNARLAAGGFIWQELLLVILGQRVTTQEAVKSWARLCHRWGEPAPGPHQLQLPPTPEAMAKVHYTDLHQVNVERRRAEVIMLAAKRANRLEEAATMTPDDAMVRLTALRGLGAWTATATIGTSHGAPDIVTLGDYGMPTMVNYFFTGDSKRLPPEPDGDRIMLSHLEPWEGHRQRVMRLFFAAGVNAPRRAPRAFNPDIRKM